MQAQSPKNGTIFRLPIVLFFYAHTFQPAFRPSERRACAWTPRRTPRTPGPLRLRSTARPSGELPRMTPTWPASRTRWQGGRSRVSWSKKAAQRRLGMTGLLTRNTHPRTLAILCKRFGHHFRLLEEKGKLSIACVRVEGHTPSGFLDILHIPKIIASECLVVFHRFLLLAFIFPVSGDCKMNCVLMVIEQIVLPLNDSAPFAKWSTSVPLSVLRPSAIADHKRYQRCRPLSLIASVSVECRGVAFDPRPIEPPAAPEFVGPLPPSGM